MSFLMNFLQYSIEASRRIMDPFFYTSHYSFLHFAWSFHSAHRRMVISRIILLFWIFMALLFFPASYYGGAGANVLYSSHFVRTFHSSYSWVEINSDKRFDLHYIRSSTLAQIESYCTSGILEEIHHPQSFVWTVLFHRARRYFTQSCLFRSWAQPG